jgi:hypothetical protein
MLLRRVSRYQERSWLAYGQPVDIWLAHGDRRSYDTTFRFSRR